MHQIKTKCKVYIELFLLDLQCQGVWITSLAHAKSYSNYFGHIVFIGETILKLFVVLSKTYGLQKDDFLGGQAIYHFITCQSVDIKAVPVAQAAHLFLTIRMVNGIKDRQL